MKNPQRKAQGERKLLNNKSIGSEISVEEYTDSFISDAKDRVFDLGSSSYVSCANEVRGDYILVSTSDGKYAKLQC